MLGKGPGRGSYVGFRGVSKFEVRGDSDLKVEVWMTMVNIS